MAESLPECSGPDSAPLQVEDRYRLTGDVLDGQMDLEIVNVRRTDSGPYCCRVDIDGIFNDKKSIMNLRVVKGEERSHLVTPGHRGNALYAGFSLVLITNVQPFSSSGHQLSSNDNHNNNSQSDHRTVVVHR